MVDAEAVDRAVPVQGEQQGVGGHEHDGVLDAHRDERGDVEEASVVQGLPRLAPARQAVRLRVDELGQRQPLGAGRNGELGVVVAQDRVGCRRPTVRGEHQFAGLESLLERSAEHRHQEPVVLGDPVDVEPPGIRRAAALPQQRPERGVEVGRLRHRHVVGHDVDDDAEPRGAARGDQTLEATPATGRFTDPGVVEHVVAVHRARRRLEHG